MGGPVKGGEVWKEGGRGLICGRTERKGRVLMNEPSYCMLISIVAQAASSHTQVVKIPVHFYSQVVLGLPLLCKFE